MDIMTIEGPYVPIEVGALVMVDGQDYEDHSYPYSEKHCDGRMGGHSFH